MTSDRDDQTRLTLFIPGTARSIVEWNSGLAPSGRHIAGGVLTGIDSLSSAHVTWVPNDGAFARAFGFGTVPDAGLKQIDAAPGAIVLDLPLDLMTGRSRVVEIVRGMRDAGALAVRIEQSKLGWLVDEWIGLFEGMVPRAQYNAAVCVLTEDHIVQTCGMHAFSLPDVRIEFDGDPAAAEYFANELNVYQLAEGASALHGTHLHPRHGHTASRPGALARPRVPKRPCVPQPLRSLALRDEL